jgi:hypothetical protein
MTSESLPIIAEPNGENKFPRLGLVLPGSVPGMIVGVAYLIEAAGHQWNIHGDAILVMGLVFLSATIAFVFLVTNDSQPTLRAGTASVA